MRALLRKDAIWMLTLAVDGMVIGFLAMTSVTNAAGVWYRPDSDFGPGSLIFLWIAAGVLGLVAGLFEDVTSTREYLLHRPVSAARLFWTRQLGCALVLVTWIVVTPALHLGAILLFHHNAPLVEPGRYWSMLNAGSVGVAFYALTLFATTAVRRAVVSVVIAFALSLALLLFYGGALYGNHSLPLVARLLAPLSLALAAPLLLASQRLSREPRDVDQPGSRPRLAAAVGALLFFSLAGSAFLHILQLDLRRDITRRYPKMARLADGTPLLVAHKDKDYVPPWRVDERHRRIEGSAAQAELAFEPRVSSPLRSQKKPFGERGRWTVGGVRYERAYCGIPVAGCFLGSDGRLHLYGYDPEDGPAPVYHLGKHTGEPFSAAAEVVGYWARFALITEPGDGSLWRFDFQRGGPGFVPAALPGGDAFAEDLTDIVEPASYVPLFGPHPTVLRGRHGVYVLEKDRFQAAPPEIQSAVETLDRRRQRPEAQIEHRGPVRFRATLPAAGPEPAFSHDYAPYTLAEKALSLQMHALSLLRPPLLVLPSLLLPHVPAPQSNSTDDDARILLDPLVMLGARWVLALDLLLAAALATLTLRRLTRLRLPPTRRAFWSALVLAFGPAGFIVSLACERPRAWHPVEEPATAKQPLIIQTAA